MSCACGRPLGSCPGPDCPHTVANEPFAAADRVVVLADAMNQFCITVEEFASRWKVSARARGFDGEVERWDSLFKAARQLREDIAEVIQE